MRIRRTSLGSQPQARRISGKSISRRMVLPAGRFSRLSRGARSRNLGAPTLCFTGLRGLIPAGSKPPSGLTWCSSPNN